jgi:hypothetical protein
MARVVRCAGALLGWGPNRALSGSRLTTAPVLVRSIISSAAESWRGHCVRSPPFGSPNRLSERSAALPLRRSVPIAQIDSGVEWDDTVSGPFAFLLALRSGGEQRRGSAKIVRSGEAAVFHHKFVSGAGGRRFRKGAAPTC